MHIQYTGISGYGQFSVVKIFGASTVSVSLISTFFGTPMGRLFTTPEKY
jgi:hypothetical protein